MQTTQCRLSDSEQFASEWPGTRPLRNLTIPGILFLIPRVVRVLKGPRRPQGRHAIEPVLLDLNPYRALTDLDVDHPRARSLEDLEHCVRSTAEVSRFRQLLLASTLSSLLMIHVGRDEADLLA